MRFLHRRQQAKVMMQFPRTPSGAGGGSAETEEEIRQRSFSEAPDSEPRYEQVANAEDLKQVNRLIRQAVPLAQSQEDLTKLYRQSLYLVTLTRSPNWREIRSAERTAARQFSLTARKINKRAAAMGVQDYDAVYG